MIVNITETAVAVTDTDNLGKFHVTAEGLSPEVLAQRIAEEDTLSGTDTTDAVWVTIASLHGAVAQEQQADFEGMIGYAQSKGWVSEDGTLVRGHIQ